MVNKDPNLRGHQNVPTKQFVAVAREGTPL